MNFLLFDEIDSTNIWAKEHFFELQDRTVVVAKSQTKGKGRFDRKWVSQPCGNLYMSIVLKLESTQNVSNLTQLMSVCCAEIISQYNISTNIKWPNDVLVSGKKISGILNEIVNKDGKYQGCVLGIGVNLNMSDNNLSSITQPYTSLFLETGSEVDVLLFAEKLCEKFFERYDDLIKNGFKSIEKMYTSYVNYLGSEVAISENLGQKKTFYKALGFDSNGNLVVLDSESCQKVIYSGDLIL